MEMRLELAEHFVTKERKLRMIFVFDSGKEILVAKSLFSLTNTLEALTVAGEDGEDTARFMRDLDRSLSKIPEDLDDMPIPDAEPRVEKTLMPSSDRPKTKTKAEIQAKLEKFQAKYEREKDLLSPEMREKVALGLKTLERIVDLMPE